MIYLILEESTIFSEFGRKDTILMCIFFVYTRKNISSSGVAGLRFLVLKFSQTVLPRMVCPRYSRQSSMAPTVLPDQKYGAEYLCSSFRSGCFSAIYAVGISTLSWVRVSAICVGPSPSQASRNIHRTTSAASASTTRVCLSPSSRV